jgi:predicted hydrocarbon binding protein
LPISRKYIVRETYLDYCVNINRESKVGVMGRLKIWIDKNKGEVYFNGSSIFIWRRDFSGRIQREYERIIGPATRVIFSEATRKSMRPIFFRMADRYKDVRHKSVSRLAMKMLEELPRYGYGIPEVIFIDEKRGAAKVRIHNCFNKLGYENVSRPVCYRMEGILAGLFEVAFKRKAVCRETKCAAMDHSCCEFEISTYNIPVKAPRGYPEMPKGLVPVELEFDPERGEIIQSRVNSIFSPRGDLRSLEQESEGIIGPVTKEIWYMIGRINTMESLRRNIPKMIAMRILARFFKKKYMSKLAEIGLNRGYGLIEFLKIDMKNKRVESRVYNSVNAIGIKNSEKPVCYMIAGTMAGAADIIFGRSMRCDEVKCVAMGDPYCEFHVHPESE